MHGGRRAAQGHVGGRGAAELRDLQRQDPRCICGRQGHAHRTYDHAAPRRKDAFRRQQRKGPRLREHEAQGGDRGSGRLYARPRADARRPRTRHDAALDARRDEIPRLSGGRGRHPGRRGRCGLRPGRRTAGRGGQGHVQNPVRRRSAAVRRHLGGVA